MRLWPIALFIHAGAVLAADYPATLAWSQLAPLATGVSGVVERVHVQPGQTVRAGELLLSLNQGVYQAGVVEAKAGLDRLVEEEKDARRDLDRVQELYARSVASTTELDAAKLRHARANALLSAAQAKLEIARRQLAESEVRAPFEAVVVERRAEPGMAVAAACQPPELISVAHAGELLAQARLTPAQAAMVRLGAAASVLAEGKTLQGRVRALRYVPGDKPAYWLDVAVPRSGLLPGHAATIRLP